MAWADLDDEYVIALVAHLKGSVPVICSNPDKDIVPLLEELLRARRIVGKAAEVARMWRDQEGINAAYLDQLAVEILDA